MSQIKNKRFLIRERQGRWHSSFTEGGRGSFAGSKLRVKLELQNLSDNAKHFIYGLIFWKLAFSPGIIVSFKVVWLGSKTWIFKCLFIFVLSHLTLPQRLP
jgi:hypothetical protein